ncbi:hypothetical protein CBR_g31100 [Chara braunii]|uniref:Uncharacterized protein n=1 Tax=Chara braunii TaxID=69332 RepID=A0A388LEA6_CHABU|nr:hypothetical protein CBR_g31100 [Chara braunii]|eukprot:GBG80640.1 hypothetical protein CBR_g31100 [Chara braunii]
MPMCFIRHNMVEEWRKNRGSLCVKREMGLRTQLHCLNEDTMSAHRCVFCCCIPFAFSQTVLQYSCGIQSQLRPGAASMHHLADEVANEQHRLSGGRSRLSVWQRDGITNATSLFE